MKETDEIWENDGHVTTQRAILFLFRDEDPTGLSPLPFFSVTSPLLSLSLSSDTPPSSSNSANQWTLVISP
jgi:hypothetical protein